ncbi:exo-beta-N-acetylmuramidase NamZ family protein [Flavobacteriaceae bacterium 14752]|uniref:exo-beta-N-acetylmuramidase NamZ family protein n=1 Tax=Mesohalobacter salilacus TaxID=2491711 RepID=UPI000F641678|nr:DUF1343 domain-containing protein [Flavobacteriaceae bacterium 14752]
MKYSKFNLYAIFYRFKNTVLFSLFLILGCQAQDKSFEDQKLQTGADQTKVYLNDLAQKNAAVVANQTSVISNNGNYIHLVDSLLALDIKVKKVFAPEHGFRGQADAGEKVDDAVDAKTGLPIISLYGSHKKPTAEDLKGIEIVVFDIQDVGVRFYTYISTLHYVMEACAELDIPLIVLDRPNPNRHYIDGSLLEEKHSSFVGMHPVPVVYGLTIGEYAKMINGEQWLKNQIKCKLKVVSLKHYNTQKHYELPIKPSPNLPNGQAINLYPSLCFFEGTNVNAGRGTSTPFQVFGSPFLDQEKYDFEYIPKSNLGSKYPKHQGEICYGLDLTEHQFLSEIHLDWLIEAYQNTSNQDQFFNSFFTKLAGTTRLQSQIEKGMNSSEIKATWRKDLEDFKKLKKQYHLY